MGATARLRHPVETGEFTLKGRWFRYVLIAPDKRRAINQSIMESVSREMATWLLLKLIWFKIADCILFLIVALPLSPLWIPVVLMDAFCCSERRSLPMRVFYYLTLTATRTLDPDSYRALRTDITSAAEGVKNEDELGIENTREAVVFYGRLERRAPSDCGANQISSGCPSNTNTCYKICAHDLTNFEYPKTAVCISNGSVVATVEKALAYNNTYFLFGFPMEVATNDGVKISRRDGTFWLWNYLWMDQHNFNTIENKAANQIMTDIKWNLWRNLANCGCYRVEYENGGNTGFWVRLLVE
ncbi:hypothetical protein DFJ73DRAFT_765675 [Zopfochytrium polystomum]|nr:hypothetical protein DFJ73DRAFT_765675 [Zopfochytrium polystomum]